MSSGINHVCPMERAHHLELSLRRWLQNPKKILNPYIREGMSVLDFGCGPGFFTIDMARLAGESGRVIAADLQEGMLNKLRGKIAATELQSRISLHKCRADALGLSEQVDFALAFYVMHELQDQKRFFDELRSVLKAEGGILIVEPPFHVSKSDFHKTIQKGLDAGFFLMDKPKIFPGMAALLKKKSD